MTTGTQNRATTARDERVEERTVAGVKLEVLAGGQGHPLLVLHDYEYLNEWQPFEEELSQRFSLLVPSHPGYGRSELPKDFDCIDDVVVVYQELLRELGPANVLGMGVGGWIAAEMAVRCGHDIRRLVLAGAVGIKVSDRTTRDIGDTFIVGPQDILKMTWHDPELGAQRMKIPGLGDLSEETLITLLRNRQTTALYAWKPFLHNPKLRGRLWRVNVPTLVLWGESDRLVTPEYGRAYAQAIPNAQFQTIPAAGHYPYLEQPQAFVQAVTAFLSEES